MRKIIPSLLVLGLVLGLDTATIERASAATVTGASATLYCDTYDISPYTWTSDRDNTGTGEEAVEIQITDGAGKLLDLTGTSVPVGSTSPAPGGLGFSYNSGLPDYNPLTFRWVSLAGNGLDEQVAYETIGACPGLPTYEADNDEDNSNEAIPQPGCDMYPMPNTAVVGQFTRDTVVEWEPGQASDTTVKAGKTAWVLSINDAGTHYHISIGCTQAWVPVGNMGPNYDEVWQGAPLPSNHSGSSAPASSPAIVPSTSDPTLLILQMVQNGTITAQDAALLLSALN